MISALAGWAKVEFAALEERYNSIGLRTMFDTRSNIVNPGNSVYAAAEWKRLMFDEREEDIDVVSVDLRGYFRVVGRTMIAGQARFDTASTALPLYLKPFMGGSSSLRGYESGEFIGDNRFTCSLELRQPVLPLDTPIDAGVYVFYDTGKVYEDGFAFGDVDYHDSFGIGSYAFAMGFGLRIDIGRNEEGDTRFHLMTAMKF
jgi:hemolysin activation/secretion protein